MPGAAAAPGPRLSVAVTSACSSTARVQARHANASDQWNVACSISLHGHAPVRHKKSSIAGLPAELAVAASSRVRRSSTVLMRWNSVQLVRWPPAGRLRPGNAETLRCCSGIAAYRRARRSASALRRPSRVRRPARTRVESSRARGRRAPSGSNPLTNASAAHEARASLAPCRYAAQHPDRDG